MLTNYILKMKKLFSLFAILVLVSCSDDVKFNNPGFQAYRDDILFRAISVQANESTSGTVTIEGLAQDETLKLSMASSAVGTYSLGTTNAINRATYDSNFGGNQLSYATDEASGPVTDIEKPAVNAGSGYTSDCTIDLQGNYICPTSHQTTTTGAGSGLTISIIQNSGVITYAKVTSPGDFYEPGDLVTIVGGDNNATFRILNTQSSNGEIVIEKNIAGRITGTFKFNAVKTNVNPFANDVINIQHGAFYDLQLVPAP